MTKLTERLAKIDPTDFKRTKMVATVGPASHSYEKIHQLILAGVNVVRLNFSHGDHDEKAQVIKWVRRASEACDKPIAIIQDLQGPKIRLGQFEGVIPVAKNQVLRFAHNANYASDGLIPLQYDLAKKVKRGQRLYLFDGSIKTIISSVRKGVVTVESQSEGILIKGRGINLPDTNFEGEVITSKDKQDLAFGSAQGVDYVALSFAQTAKDILSLKKQLKNLGSTARVICKLESKSAVDNLESIISVSDALMVARGDLAYEVGPEAVPLIQRQAIQLCIKYAKPSIVATQMLISMVQQSEPTRAEVSDVSTAVLLGADALMLSDETAVGKYPVETVKTMKRIIKYNEDNQSLDLSQLPANRSQAQIAICGAIVSLAKQTQAVAIVAETKSGATAYQIAAHRPNQPIIAVTSNYQVAQQLALVRGVKAFIRLDGKLQGHKLTDWLQASNVLNKGDMIVSTSGRYPGVIGATDTIKVRQLE